MGRSELLEQVRAIIRRELDDPFVMITDDTIVDEIPDWDSVVYVQIIVAIEGHFGILFDPNEYMEFANVGDMIDCIIKKLELKIT